MNSPITSTATPSTLEAAAHQAAIPPWKKTPLWVEAWVPVMHDGSPCLPNCVTGTVGAFATEEEAETAACNCTSYGGPNKSVKMTLKVKVESYCQNPGFAGYYA